MFTIKGKKMEHERMMITMYYCAIYPRVSTGQQVTDGTSLDGQTQICVDKAKTMGYKDSQIKVYREEGKSGEDIDIRPAMTKLREDVASGIIKHVIVQHPDRLSRDMTDKLIICRELEKNGAELIFTDTEFTKTPEGILFFNIISSIAAYELALIKKRTVRGRLRAVEKDKKIMPMRTAPYGYDLIDGKLVINEDEAAFVKKIYHWYVHDHLTLRQIGEKLYEQGALPKRKESKNWSASSIRRILSSEIYIGKYYYNRRKSEKVKGAVTAGGNPKKKLEMRDEEDWILVEVAPIVDEVLFELAQTQKVKNTKKSGNVKNEYLLKGLIRCDHCGRIWQSTTYNGRADKETGEKKKYNVYRCPNLAPKKYGPEVKKCETPSIRASVLEDYIWNLVVQSFSNPLDYQEVLDGESSDALDDVLQEINHKKKYILQKEKQKEKLKHLFLDDLITQDELKKDMEKINSELTLLKNELKKYENIISVHEKNKLTQETKQEIIKATQHLLQKDGLTFEEKQFILHKLIDEIVIHYNEEKELEVKIIGVLNTLDIMDEHDMELSTQPQKV
jgi:site-specific DNA recombinase